MELEQCGEDMDKMAELLDEMEELNKNATDLDMTLLDRNIDKMMPELGFSPDDNDQLVAAYRFIFAPSLFLQKELHVSSSFTLWAKLKLPTIPLMQCWQGMQLCNPGHEIAMYRCHELLHREDVTQI